MAPHNATQLLSNKADGQLTLSSINAGQIQGTRPVARWSAPLAYMRYWLISHVM